jgi:hypothetical protein
LEKCLKCPKSEDFKILLADAYLKNTSVEDWNSESINKSIKLLEDVLKIDPQNPNANKILGVIYLKQNKETLGQQFLNYAAEYGANMNDPIIRKDGVFRLGRKSNIYNESTPDKQSIKMNNEWNGQGQEEFSEND